MIPKSLRKGTIPQVCVCVCVLETPLETRALIKALPSSEEGTQTRDFPKIRDSMKGRRSADAALSDLGHGHVGHLRGNDTQFTVGF